MIRLKNSVFLHTPKSGGRSVRTYLRDHYNVLEEMQFHEAYKQIKHCSNLTYFIFIRHPLTWYQSWWAYRKLKLFEPNKTPIPTTGLLEKYLNPDFNKWLSNVLEVEPKFYSKLVNDYIKFPVDLIGRQEYLERDLKRILDLLGEQPKSDHQVLAGIGKSGPKPAYSKDNMKIVLESEKLFIEKYYPETFHRGVPL